jgi:type IV pilus assembly protein PilC
MLAIQHKEALYSQLGRLLTAGFPIQQAADSILAQGPPATRRRVLESLKRGLAQGHTIAGSLAAAISPLEAAVLDASEKCGRLADGCHHLATYYALIFRTIRQVITKMIYPLALLHLAILLPVLLPRLIGIGENPPLLAGLGWPLFYLWGGIAIACFAGQMVLKVAEKSSLLDRLINLIPLVGTLRRSLSLARFTKVLEISLVAGMKVDTAVSSAAEASQSGALLADAQRLVPQLAAGNPLGPMLRHTSLPREVADGLSIGEQAGELDDEAARWAAYLSDQADRAATALGFWIPSAMGLLVMISLGWHVVSLYKASMQGAMDQMKEIGNF